MNKTYEQCQYLALGLLAGYFGLYAIDWFKSWNKNKQAQAQKSTETNQKEPIANV